MTNAASSPAAERANCAPLRNRAAHCELIGQTRGGIFAFLPQEASDPDRARAFGRGLCIRILRRRRVTAVTKAICGERAKTMPAWLTPLRETVGKWSEHKDARLGAALAYYSVFSIGPLILIAIAIAGLVFGAGAVQGQVLGTLKGMLGDSGTQAVEAMLEGADRPREGMVATVIGIGTLVFAAIGVVVQLKDALNTVWEVETGIGGLAVCAQLHPVFGRGARARFPAPDLDAADRGAGCRGKICRSLPAGGHAAGRGLRRVVRGDLPALRHDVQMAS